MGWEVRHNGWVATHSVELELAVRPPVDRASRDHLDRAKSRAQKRMTEAAHELARVRRLQAPAVIARVRAAVLASADGLNPRLVSAVPPPPPPDAGQTDLTSGR